VSLGPGGLFLLAVLDSTGVPLPAGVDALLLALAVVDPARASFSALLAVAGSTAGCMALFYIAKRGGERYLERHTRKGWGRKFREWFRRYGLITVFIPALVPVPLPTKVFVISAGALGVHPLPFLLVVLAARIPRYFGLAYLGSQLGAHSTAWLRAHAWELLAVAVGLFLFLALLVKLAERRPSAELG